MTQWSAFWGGTATGDAAGATVDAPYSDDEFSDLWSILFLYDRTVQGVIQTNRSGYTGLLEVTNPSGSTIRVANGLALVDGKVYGNTANVDEAVDVPGSNTNYYLVVLTKDFAAQTVRIDIKEAAGNSNGGASTAVGYPTVTQTDGTTWEIALAQVSVTSGPTVTITDVREWVRPISRLDSEALQADPGGNARGSRAVDFQQNRTNDTEVASGDGSFVAGGSDNTASGENSFAHGSGCTASGDQSHAEGFETVASGDDSHAEGNQTEAQALGSHAEGDRCVASAFHSHAEGQLTTASAAGSHSEGSLTTASGANAHAEGLSTEATGQHSHAEGIYSKTSRISQHSFASGRFSTTGDAQGSRFACYKQITHDDGTWRDVPISADGSTAPTRMILDSDTVWTVDVLIVGTTSGCGKSFGFRVEGVIENDGGTTTILGQSVTTIYDTDDTSFDAQIVADDANDQLKVQVQDTDGTGDTVNWVAVVRTVEVTYP